MKYQDTFKNKHPSSANNRMSERIFKIIWSRRHQNREIPEIDVPMYKSTFFQTPFIANLYMSNFETKMKSENKYFPSVLVRYVDHIVAIFNTTKSSVRDCLRQLNS